MAYEQLFEEAGRQFNVDPALLRAQMQVESGGNPNAKSEVGAQGLMQIMPSTQRSLGVTNPNDPQQAIFGAARLMAENLDRYGNVADAVRAYHGGTDQANWGPKTQAYVNNVLKGYGGSPATAAAPVADDLDAYLTGGPAVAAAAPADDLDAYLAGPAAAPAAPAVAAPVQAAPVTVAPAPAPTGGEFVKASLAPKQPAPADTGIPGMMLRGIDEFGAQGVRNANAIGRGISDVFDAPAEWLASGAEASGLTGLLGKAGIDMPTYEQQVALNKASRDEYAARTRGGLQEGASRLTGNILGSTAPIAKAGEAIGAGGNFLLNAIKGTPAIAKAAPAAQAAGRFIAGVPQVGADKAGMLSRMFNLGTQGAAGAALLSGAGSSDTPLAEQMAVGGVLGMALPPAYKLGASLIGGGRNVANLVTQPFTEGGRMAIPTKVIAEEAAAAGGVPKTVMPYAAPGQAPTPFAPGPTGIPGTAPAAAEATQPLATSVDDILGKASSGGKLAANFNEIIPGSRPTLSQATGNAGIATLERSMASRSTEAANAFDNVHQANHAARLEFFNNLRGNAQTLEQAIAQREETAIPLLNKALEGRVPANANPVITEIDSILASPDGKRKAVRTAMAQVKENIQDASGALETDAAQLYGVRKAINDQLEKVAGKDNSEAQQAAAQLLQVKAKLDDVIEKAAPNFKEYLKQYAELSKPVTSQGYLQNLDLTEQTSSQITLNSVKKAINKIERMRKSSGANEGKDISPEQMDGLYRLQADLQRDANYYLGRVKGSSDTTQLMRQNNLIDLMLGNVGGKVASAAPTSIGTGIGFLMGGGPGAALGGLIGQNVGSAAGKAINAQAPAVEANLLQMLTRPQGPEVLKGLTPKATDSLLERAMNRGAPGVFNRGN